MTYVSQVVFEMVDGQSPHMKNLHAEIIQKKINQIADECIAQLSAIADFCFVATKKEMRAFRVNLAERYHIFVAAHEADFEEDVPVPAPSGYPTNYNTTTTRKEMIRHVHNQEREFNLTKRLDLNGDGLCWNVIFNWLQKPEFPLGVVPFQVQTYIDYCAKNDSFYNRSGWQKIVGTRVHLLAMDLVGCVNEERKKGVRKFTVAHCVRACSEEMVLLAQVFEVHCNRVLVEFKKKKDVHAHGTEIHLTKELGGFIDPRESICYELSLSWGEEKTSDNSLLMLTYQ